MDPHVLHNTDLTRYELWLDDKMIGLADYKTIDGVMNFTHTEVNPEHQGKNYAAILMREALKDIEDNQLGKVWPVCPYVVKYIQRHPETQGLLAKPLD